MNAEAPARASIRRPLQRCSSISEVLRRNLLLRRWLACADIVACAAALLIATEVIRADQLRWTLALAFLLVIPLGKIIGLYDRDELLLRKSTLDETPGLFRLATGATLLLWLTAPLLVVGSLHRDQILVFWGTLLLLLSLARIVTRAVFNRLTPRERCMLVGEESACARIRGKLGGTGGINAEIVHVLSFDSSEAEANKMGDLARPEQLRELATRHDLHRLILAPYDSDAEHIRDLVQTANGLGLHLSIVPRVLEVIGSSVEFDDLNGVTILGVKRFGRLSRSSAAMKRTFDLAGVSGGLILLSPLLAVIAVAIKLDSRGPILFRQLRMGQDGKPFRMLKFRTMVDEAEAQKPSLMAFNEADQLFKIARDPRTTRVGRFLRPLYFDELPQLINVLRGNMSIVGPRPLVLDEDEHIEGWHRQRLSLTPGMTGRWQILGSARIPLHEMVKLDYLYVATWSVWNDVKIVLRTVPYVFARKGM